MNYITDLAFYYSGYKIINKNNIFNFMMIQMNKLTDDDKKLYCDDIKMILGNTFFSDFKFYIFSKLPNSPLLDFMK